jgi:dolichol-phosphate mannosyltransferase
MTDGGLVTHDGEGGLSKERALVIVPTFNERENIARLIENVLGQDPRLDILVVDDGSPDGTADIVDGIIAVNSRVNILRRPRKMGLGTAYVAGFRWALERKYDFVFEMDADFSHDPKDLARLLAATNDADLAIGSRYIDGGGVDGWGLLRRIVSRGGCWYAEHVLGVPVRDLTGGFKCYRRQVLEAIDLDTVRSQGYAFQVELTYRAVRHGFRVKEVPIVFRDREVGTSKMSWHIAVEAVWRVPQMRLRGS